MDFSQADKPAVGSVISRPNSAAAGVVSSLSYHRQGQRLYVAYGGGGGGLLQVVDCGQTGQIDRPTLKMEREKLYLVQASHHPDCVLFAGDAPEEKHAINYYSVYDNKILRKYRGHNGRIQSLSQCPVDDTFISSSATDQTVRLWTLQSAACLAECKLPTTGSTEHSIQPGHAPCAVFDGSGLVFGIAAPKKNMTGHYLHLYDARNYSAGAFAELQVSTEAIQKAIEGAATGVPPSQAFTMAQQPWTSMAFNGAGNQILVTGEQGLCLLLDGFEGTVQQALVPSSSSASSTTKSAVACFTTDDRHVLLGKEDGNIDVWSITNGTSSFTKTLKGHGSSGPVSCLASNPMYAQFASASRETALWTM